MNEYVGTRILIVKRQVRVVALSRAAAGRVLSASMADILTSYRRDAQEIVQVDEWCVPPDYDADPTVFFAGEDRVVDWHLELVDRAGVAEGNGASPQRLADVLQAVVRA